jgi:glycosyltransferase involved in cell wall biosynthesis
MQLHATIDSFLLHCTDKDNVDLNVLYNTSTMLHAEQYDRLKLQFPEINFIKEASFRHQTLSNIEKNEYVLFLVDDNIFVKPFSIQKIIRALQKEKDAIGFSLRLGKNTTDCYSLSSQQEIPAFTKIGEGIQKYRWLNEQCDFGYPLEVSSSVYRSKDMLRLLRHLDFVNPNTLEGAMASNRNFDPNLSHLLTFEESVTFCNPVNVVQNVTNNKFGTQNNYTSKKLADYFSQGKLIDVKKYIGFTPNAAHQERELYFKDADVKKTFKPDFSIIMANYNNEKYIGEAIESVLNQTFKNWELIIVEDCSTDNSLQVIKKYINDKRLRLIHHEKNKGYTAALKTGIADVKSEYFGIFDSDDHLVDNAIEIMYDAHVKNPDCGLIYSQYVKCNLDLTPREIGHCNKIPPGKTNLETNVVSHFKTFKLCDYLKTTGYDEDILYAEDRDIAYKMEEVTNLLFVDKCLYYYRELPNSQGHNPEKRSIGIQTRQQAVIDAVKRRLRSCPDKLPAVVMQQINTPTHQIPKHNELSNTLETLPRQPHVTTRPAEPLVSVIMPAYNAADYIEEAIESVLIQSYRNFELIVIDDGSTDNTRDIVASFKDDKIKYYYQKNKGLAGAHNTGIKNSQGLFLIKLDSDDIMKPDFITEHIQMFEKHPEADLVYCDDCLIDENSNQIRVIERPEYTDRKTLIRDLFHCGFPVVPFRTCIRRSIFDKIGFFDEKLRMAEDYDMLRRFVKHGLKIQHLPSALYLRRMTSDSLSRNYSTRNAKYHFEVIRRFTDTFTHEELFPDVAWDEIAPGMRQLHAKCLTAGTYLALGQEYLKSNALEYSRTAFDRACSELNDCTKMAPGNQDLLRLFQKAKLIRTRYSGASR